VGVDAVGRRVTLKRFGPFFLRSRDCGWHPVVLPVLLACPGDCRRCEIKMMALCCIKTLFVPLDFAPPRPSVLPPGQRVFLAGVWRDVSSHSGCHSQGMLPPFFPVQPRTVFSCLFVPCEKARLLGFLFSKFLSSWFCIKVSFWLLPGVHPLFK